MPGWGHAQHHADQHAHPDNRQPRRRAHPHLAGHRDHSAQRIGVRVELARHTVSAGERVLHGQRIDGVVRVTDVPADGPGRPYLVERGLEQEGRHATAALRALIADYLRQARQLDAIPMAHSLLARDLQDLAS